ncbi:MAG: Crp/Fnr family transcriptional regulator [Ruminococcus sp.]|nr:Crp/Fnr family transcriptional regulator [Ruminococcus sp.]
MEKENPKYSEIKTIFEKTAPVRRVSKGDIIYYQGDSAESFYYLKKGRVRVYMTSPEGVERTLSTAARGEVFGEAAFFDRMPRVSSASALTGCELVAIDEQKLIALIQRQPRLALELLEIQALRIRQLSDQLDIMTFLKADGRIARLLLKNAQTDGERLKVKLTHEEIAGSVGVNRVTVSKLLTRFKKEGIIRTEYRKIIINDIKALERIAENE